MTLSPRGRCFAIRAAAALLCASSSGPTNAAPHARSAPYWAIDVNDGHTAPDRQGHMVTAPDPGSDSAQIVLFGQPGRKMGENIRLSPALTIPATVEGPPSTVAISRDGRVSAVSSSSVAGDAPGAPMKPRDVLSILRLDHGVPVLQQSIALGDAPVGAGGVAVSPDGTRIALVTRNDGMLLFFRHDGKRFVPDRHVSFGAGERPVSVSFVASGRSALVVLRGAKRLARLRLDGAGGPSEMASIDLPGAPNAMSVSPDGSLVAVANLDKAKPHVTLIGDDRGKLIPRGEIACRPGPESVQFSPDGKALAIVSVNGSNIDQGHEGSVALYDATAPGFAVLASAPAGHWPQGSFFSPDGHALYVQGMLDRAILAYAWDGMTLRPTGRIATAAGAAGVATPW